VSIANIAAEAGADELALVADIGGTNARFALTPVAGKPELLDRRSLLVADFPTFMDAAAAYLGAAPSASRVRRGVLAVAAPSKTQQVRLTNSHWRFSLAQARQALAFDELLLINDFAANSWALPELRGAQLQAIGSRRASATEGIFAVVGPGTGLGVGAVQRGPDGRSVVIESEGGHVDFAPVSEDEEKILRHLRSRFGRVSYERLLCGRGLVNIYQALVDAQAEPSPEEITSRAAADPGAARAVKVFCEVLGSFAGNVALMYGAWGGVYLAGGMLEPMADELASGGFRRRFHDKGRFSSDLAEVPTMLVREHSLGLIGAAAALRSRRR
jgi:glucokinase